MPFTKAIGDYLYKNSTRINKLFNLKEQTDFLLTFVSQKEIDKFLSAGTANAEHVEKLIAFIQYKKHDLLYEALIKQLLQTHTQNGEFVCDMMKTCGQAEYKTAGDNNSWFCFTSDAVHCFVHRFTDENTPSVDENTDQVKRQDKEIINYINEVRVSTV